MGSQRPLRYAVSSLAVAVSVGLLFIPGLGQGLAGFLFFAVLVSAWYGGVGPGLAATALILALMLGIFAVVGQPLPAWQISALVIFGAMGLVVALIVGSLHAAWRKAETSERWFSTALKSIGDAVIATDERGRVTFINPVAEALIGWPEAEARGRDLSAVFCVLDEETREPIANRAAKALDDGRVAVPAKRTVLVARDGGEVPIDENVAPILDDRGAVSGAILIFRDVRERRAAEASRERLAAIVESSDDIIASKDLDGVITSWNRGAERTLGYTAAEIIGKNVSILIPPGHAEDTAQILERIRRGEKVEQYETRRRGKDGTIIDVSLTVSPVRDGLGRIVGAAKTGRDVTRQKLMDRQRLEADRRKDEFLAMLAHELRNPLATISNAVHLIGKADAEEIEWAKDAIMRHVKHLARLIDDLLDLSRITQGKISLRKEALDLSALVGDAVESVRPLIETRRQQLDVKVSPAALHLDADPLRVEQILVNLLTNAAKYTDVGGRIWLSVGRDGDDAVIRVRDNGMGIPPEKLPEMFELFAQGDRSLARSEGGLGIGLTLVEGSPRCTEAAFRRPATGRTPAASSRSSCPRPPRRPARIGARRRRARGPGRGSRVLVVDDNVDTARGLAKLLGAARARSPGSLTTGSRRSRTARSHRPEVILLDIGLPGMDGFDVARRLRADAQCAGSLLIAVTGYGQENDRRLSREAGFDHHLVKPVDYDLLASLLSPSN